MHKIVDMWGVVCVVVAFMWALLVNARFSFMGGVLGLLFAYGVGFGLHRLLGKKTV